MIEGSQFGSMSKGPIFLDEFHCTGDEESLSECDMYTEPGIHMCGHQHDVGVICQCKMMCVVWLQVRYLLSFLDSHQLPMTVMQKMVVVITTALRPYKATSAPVILDTHWTLINTLVLVSKVICYSIGN